LTSKDKFNAVYQDAILGRVFVEYADYYRQSRKRFWQCFQQIEQLGLPEGARVIDIGGGIMAVLLHRLLGFRAMVGDVNERAREEIELLGLSFQIIDLFSDEQPEIEKFDLIVLQEVIEHIPQPPYLVLKRLQKLLKPDGCLFLTTPNGHRFRNIAYMLAGKEILAMYKYPGPGEALGHQHEYTMKQMLWQADAAHMTVAQARYYEDGFAGASLAARIARLFTYPARLVQHWQNGIMMVLRTSMP
jgi:2-polyprenyl-3-methyl-5-hydroxy-6-metoxy-1,4-benzoquinol methylase